MPRLLRLTPIEEFLANQTSYVIRGDVKILISRNDYFEGPSTGAEIKLWATLVDLCAGTVRYPS